MRLGGRWVGPATFLSVFIANIVKNDVTSPTFVNGSLGTKAKILVNSVSGHVSGINAFSDVPQSSRTFNLNNIVNDWTKTGVAFMGINFVSKKLGLGNVIPHSIAKNILTAGIASGPFDDPVIQGGHPGTMQTQVSSSLT